MTDGYDNLTTEKLYHFKQMIRYSLTDEVGALTLKAAMEDIEWLLYINLISNCFLLSMIN